MTAKKHAKQRAASAHADGAEQATATSAPSVPTYTTDGEIKAARLAHGADYDKLIAKGAIVAPTTADLPHEELDARLAKAEAKRAKHEEEKEKEKA